MELFISIELLTLSWTSGNYSNGIMITYPQAFSVYWVIMPVIKRLQSCSYAKENSDHVEANTDHVSEIFALKLIIQRFIGWNVAWCGHISLIKERIKQLILCMHAYQRRCDNSRAFFIHSLLAFFFFQFSSFCFFSFIFLIVVVMLFSPFS